MTSRGNTAIVIGLILCINKIEWFIITLMLYCIYLSSWRKMRVFYFEGAVCRHVTIIITWLRLVNMAFRQRRTATRSKSFLSVFLVFLFFYCPVEAAISSAFIDQQTGELSISEGYRDDFVAWANFTNDIEKSGWVSLSESHVSH